jgi:4-hydroxyphenylpyruvate dioxygenase
MEIHSIHFHVRDPSQIKDLLIDKMGLQDSGWVNQVTSWYHLGNNLPYFAVSSPPDPIPLEDYLNLHPPGVQDIAFWVDNLDEIRQRVDRMGVKILEDRVIDKLPGLRIQGWGSIEHTLIQSPRSSPSHEDRSIAGSDLQNPITGIDHIVLNVPAGELDAAVDWYRDIFNFQVEQSFIIKTDRSGLFSKALISACGKIRFNINEPSSSSSQIQEFLDLNQGAGIQHIALHTNNIFQTVDQMQRQGLEFLPIPKTYYNNLKIRDLGRIESLLTSKELQALEHLQILADWSKDTPGSLLMQTFTKPIFEQPTFFFEIIQRRDRAKGFGAGNFQALFEAVEQHHEQLR